MSAPAGSLCRRCEDIPLLALFTKPVDFDIDIHSLRDAWAQSHCPFCRLLVHAFTTRYGHDYVQDAVKQESGCLIVVHQSPVDLRYDFLLRGGTGSSTFCLELRTSLPRLVKVEWAADEGHYEDWRAVPKIQRILSPQASEVDACSVVGRAVEPDDIDWEHVKRWLAACEVRHCSDLVSDDAVAPRELLAVDVERSCIVPLPEGSRYIALSYQWGKDQRLKLTRGNADYLATSGFLQTPAGRPSRTITDAMNATRILGCRFLWVDALCLVQDDADSILKGVAQMDRIYAEAWLTIVAAAGKDADSGMPGVYRDVPRTEHQMRVALGDGTIIGNMLHGDEVTVDSSRWNTRGWTFQERALSPRLLTFTSSQVYYRCDQGCFCREDICMEDGSSAAVALFDPRYQLDLVDRDLFEIYAVAVSEYSKRALTNGDDKLRAFQGILNRLGTLFRGPFHYGVPTTFFDVGLLWMPSGSVSRNRAFPSWSWAGWVGEVIYSYSTQGGMTNLCECTASQAVISTENGATLCSEIMAPSASPGLHESGSNTEAWKRIVDEDSLEVYYVCSGNEQYHYSRPLPSIAQVTPLAINSDDAGILRIRAKTASFRLTSQHNTELYVAGSTCKQGHHSLCHLAVLDSRGQMAGTVFVDGSLVPKLKGKEHKFIALSRSTLYRTANDDPSWDEGSRTFRPWTHPESGLGSDEDEGEDDHDSTYFDRAHFSRRVFWPLLDVMLLSEPEGGFVERLGLGKIHVDAFLPLAVEEVVLLR